MFGYQATGQRLPDTCGGRGPRSPGLDPPAPAQNAHRAAVPALRAERQGVAAQPGSSDPGPAAPAGNGLHPAASRGGCATGTARCPGHGTPGVCAGRSRLPPGTGSELAGEDWGRRLTVGCKGGVAATQPPGDHRRAPQRARPADRETPAEEAGGSLLPGVHRALICIS